MNTASPLGRPATSMDTIIEHSRFSWFHANLVFLAFLVMLFDGFDMQALGLAAPVIGAAWHLPRGALGPAFSSGLVGMMIGATVLSPIGDRWGRKRAVILGAVAFGVCALLTAWSRSTAELIILRLLTGAGIGLAIPNTVALCAEYAPLRFRATSITTMFVGFTTGGVVAGLTASSVIPAYGWPALFVLGGTLPLVIAAIAWFALPESLQYLLTRHDGEPRVRAVLRKIVPPHLVEQSASFVATRKERTGLPVRHLFTEGRMLLTILLWTCYVANLFTLYFILNWLPTVIDNAGLSLQRAAIVTAWFSVGGIIGSLLIGRLIDRKITQPVGWFFGLGAVMIVLIGTASTSGSMVEAATFGAGIFVIGAQAGLNALAGLSYPKFMLATGVGWALGIGRLGSIIGPVVGGQLVAWQLSVQQTFVCGATPMVIGGIACFGLLRLRRKTSAQALRLEEASPAFEDGASR